METTSSSSSPQKSVTVTVTQPPKNVPTTLTIEPYTVQMDRWPHTGRHILAHYDDTSVVVYQAFNEDIAAYAVQHQKLGGPHFRLGRMSWIKTNFCWMQYRSGWNTKGGQERTLAIKIGRQAFNTILAHAVEGKYSPDCGLSQEDWLEKKNCGDVRLQWDPDYWPVLALSRKDAEKLERRAIQLGLRGDILQKYAQQWILSVEDITDFVIEMRTRLEQATDTEIKGVEGGRHGNFPNILQQIYIPIERLYLTDGDNKYPNLNIKQL